MISLLGIELSIKQFIGLSLLILLPVGVQASATPRVCNKILHPNFMDVNAAPLPGPEYTRLTENLYPPNSYDEHGRYDYLGRGWSDNTLNFVANDGTYLGLVDVETRTRPHYGSFIAPTEFHIHDSVGILQHSEPGIYFTVGTERGFMSAALSYATHLVLVDMDANQVKYNQINIALLEVSKSLEDYLALR